MDVVLTNCEKEIQANLTQLKLITDAYQDILGSIKKIKDSSEGLTLPSTTEELITLLIKKTPLIPFNIIPRDEKEPTVVNNTLNTGSSENVNDKKANNQQLSKVQQETSSGNNSDSESSTKEDIFIEKLLSTAGGRKGVKYQVEVTSALAKDGTFWACNVEAGFIQDKLEPLSDFLKKSTRDRSLWNVDKNDMVCTKSLSYGLWMRAIIIKEYNNEKVQIRFVDVGKMEDCLLSRLTKVPLKLAEVPFMAFNCRFFEKNLDLSYEAKWTFSDLTKKKILNFTVENLIQDNNLTYLVGKLETILDSPTVNITEEIRKFAKNLSKSSNGSGAIVTRDIRVQDPTNTNGFTSKTEIIRNSDEQVKTDSLSATTTKSKNVSFNESPSKVGLKETTKPSPIIIPTAEELSSTPLKDDIEEGKMNWGDCTTPGADDEFELPPLDEHIFDTPSNSHEEEQLREKLRRDKEDYESAQKLKPNDVSTVNKNLNDTFQGLKDNNTAKDSQEQLCIYLDMLIQRQKEMMQNGSFIQQNPQEYKNLQQQIEIIGQQLHSVMQNNQFNSTGIDSSMNMQNQNQLNQSQLHNQPPSFLDNSNFQNDNQQMFSHTKFTPNKQYNESSNSPSTTYPGSMSQFFPPGHEFTMKIQQLDAITRCLEMPNNVLDNEQIQQLHIKKENLEQQLEIEEKHKNYLKQQLEYNQKKLIMSMYEQNAQSPQNNMLSQQQNMLPQQQQNMLPQQQQNMLPQQQNMLPQQQQNMLPQQLNQEQQNQYGSLLQQQQYQQQQLQHQLQQQQQLYLQHQNNLNQSDKSQHQPQYAPPLSPHQQIAIAQQLQHQQQQQNSPIQQQHLFDQKKFPFNQQTSTQQQQFPIFNQTQAGQEPSSLLPKSIEQNPDFVNPKFLQNSNTQNIKVSNETFDKIIASQNTEQLGNSQPLNQKDFDHPKAKPTEEIVHKTMNNEVTPDPQGFKIPSYDILSTESNKTWIDREIFNLNNSLLFHPKASFFSTVAYQKDNGRFNPNLAPVYRNKLFWLLDRDEEVFREEWKKRDGPIFLIIKFKPFDGMDAWRVGGILMVGSSIVPTPASNHRHSMCNFQCRIKFISTSVMMSDLRSNKTTREVTQVVARNFIKTMISKLSEGRCQNLFAYQYEIIQKYSNKHASNERPTNTFRSQPSNTTSTTTPSTTAVTSSRQQSVEDWDEDLVNNESSAKSFVSVDYGSGDECDSDMKDDFDVFGLNQEDL